jgi:hypothetical protein
MVSTVDSQRKNKTNDEKILMETAAKKSHELLKKLSPKFREMSGFRTKEELEQSSLGYPLEIHMVALKGLKKYKAGDDPKKIIFDTEEIIYPVYVRDTLKSSISIRRREGKWQHASIGGFLIHAAVPARESISKISRRHTSSYFIVQVPAMYLVFIGYYTQNKLYLVKSHQQHPDFQFELNKPLLAGDVFARLQPLVEKYEKVLIPYKK